MSVEHQVHARRRIAAQDKGFSEIESARRAAARASRLSERHVDVAEGVEVRFLAEFAKDRQAVALDFSPSLRGHERSRRG